MNTNTIRIFQILNILAAAIEFTYNLGKQSRPYILGAVAITIILAKISFWAASMCTRTAFTLLLRLMLTVTRWFLLVYAS